MKDHNHNYRDVLNAQQKLINQLKQENQILKQNFYNLEQYSKSLKESLLNQKQESLQQKNINSNLKLMITNAQRNADLIVAKALNISYNFKLEIESLWLEIESSLQDPQKVLKSLNNFLEKNEKIFLVNFHQHDNLFKELEQLLQEKIE